MNNKKIILDLCGGSGSWSKPYREAGYDVRVLTLPDYDVTQTLYGDTLCGKPSIVAFRNISRLNYMEIDYSHIYGILAAPPCTEFSIAKSTAPRDLAEGMQIVRACLELIWHCQIHGRLKFWALENPIRAMAIWRHTRKAYIPMGAV